MSYALQALTRKLCKASSNTASILISYIIVVTVASVYPFFLPDKDGYKLYNNYLIFKQSFYHLIHHKDLYVLYLDEQWDLYKYSPAFALFMGVFAWMPDMPGAIGWNLLNAIVLFFAIDRVPQLKDRARQKILLFVFLEMLTSIQNFQSNALLAGLIVFAFVSFEKGRSRLAALFIVLTVFIKLFGIVAFALFLFYPEKLKFIVASIFWVLLFFFLPVIVIPWGELQDQYASWGRMLFTDHSTSYGLSVMGWLARWFGLGNLKNIVVIAGVILFCLPLIRVSLYKNAVFRLLMLSSLLLWMVIFNHKAESPTFVIAICGAAIWYFSQPPGKLNLALLVFAFIFTSLSPTEFFRPAARAFVHEYILKALPCILIWLKLVYDLMILNKQVKVLPDSD